MKFNLFSIAFFCFSIAFSQNKGSISGIISDKESKNAPLAYANVSLKNTTYAVTTDLEGKYKISAESGNYTLQISFIGYETVEMPVTIKANENLKVNKSIGSGGYTLEDVVIKKAVSREKETALLTEQKKAVEIKQSIGAQELSRKGVSEQNFDFSIQTKEIDDYVQLFNKKLKGFSYADIKGNVHLNKYELNLDADIPSFSYAGKEFTNTQFSGRGNRDSLKAVLLVDNIKLNDSMQFPKSRVYITASNNVSEIHLFTSANKTLDLAELNATVTHREDGLEIQFAQSSFVMNGNKWLLEKDGKISLLPGKVTANKVKFVHDNQHIILSTELNLYNQC